MAAAHHQGRRGRAETNTVVKAEAPRAVLEEKLLEVLKLLDIDLPADYYGAVEISTHWRQGSLRGIVEPTLRRRIMVE